jgi:serine/threonine protein kinase
MDAWIADAECRGTSLVTMKSDVYSFGVVVLQMLVAPHHQQHLQRQQAEGDHHGSWGRLARWVRGNFPDRVTMMLDPAFHEEPPSRREEVVQLMALGLHCTHESPDDRPTMAEARSSVLRIQSHDRTSARFLAPLDDVLGRSIGSASYATLSNQELSFGTLPAAATVAAAAAASSARREDEERFELLFFTALGGFSRGRKSPVPSACSLFLSVLTSVLCLHFSSPASLAPARPQLAVRPQRQPELLEARQLPAVVLPQPARAVVRRQRPRALVQQHACVVVVQ